MSKPFQLAMAMIAAERRRQILREGYSPEHDADHVLGELALEAACLAVDSTGATVNWPREWMLGERGSVWGIAQKHRGDRVRQLTIAGALIAAELERVMRADPPEEDFTLSELEDQDFALKDAVDWVRAVLTETRLKIIAEKWGIWQGRVVQYRGMKHKVVTIEVSRDPAASKPWLKGCPIRRDGSYGVVVRHMFADWELDPDGETVP